MSTTNAETILREARRWKLRLEPRRDRIAIVPGSKAPPEFVELVRDNKAELLSWFEARAAGLKPDEIPWVHLAKQILLGEWDGADSSTRESLLMGLRSINRPVCRAASERLLAASQREQ